MYTHIEQMLAELGDGAELSVYVKDKELCGEIWETIGGDRFQVLQVRFSFCDFGIVMGELNDQAEEWLLEQAG